MIYVIGKVGERVRIFVQTDEEERARNQVEEGEVCFPSKTRESGIITASGDGFVVAPAFNYEERLAELRSIRNSRLMTSDWTQLPNGPLSPEKQAEWAEYRNALRIMFEVQTDPTLETVVWPVAPD